MKLYNACDIKSNFNLFLLLFSLIVIFSSAAFGANFKEDFLWINTDKTKTKITCVNVGSYDNKVNVKFVFKNKLNEKISIKKTIELGEEKEFSISDFNSNDSNINKLKVPFGNLSIYSDSVDAVCVVSYDFLKKSNNKISNVDNSLIDSIINLGSLDIRDNNSYFIYNNFLYKNVKYVRLYIYNLSKNKFDANLKRYNESGKTIKEKSISISPSERKILRYSGKSNESFVLGPKSNNVKYISYMALEFNDGSIFTFLPLQKFHETSFLKSQGLLSMFNTSSKQKKLSYKVYDGGNLKYEDDFIFEPYTQKFVNLERLTKNLELPIIKFGKFDNSKNFIVGSLVKNDKNNFNQIRFVDKRNNVGTHNISYYNFTENEGVMNVFNESSKDGSLKIAFLSCKEINLKLQKNSLVQVPLNNILKNKDLKGNVIINSEFPFSINFENLKGKEKTLIGYNLILLNNINNKNLINSLTNRYIKPTPIRRPTKTPRVTPVPTKKKAGLHDTCSENAECAVANSICLGWYCECDKVRLFSDHGTNECSCVLNAHIYDEDPSVGCVCNYKYGLSHDRGACVPCDSTQSLQYVDDSGECVCKDGAIPEWGKGCVCIFGEPIQTQDGPICPEGSSSTNIEFSPDYSEQYFQSSQSNIVQPSEGSSVSEGSYDSLGIYSQSS